MQLISPKNGETVSLLTDAQKAFLSADRSEEKALDIHFLDICRVTEKDLSLPLPVVFQTDECRQASILLYEEGEDTPAFTLTIKGSLPLYNLKSGMHYRACLLSDGIRETTEFYTAPSPRLLFVDGITNVRDVCAYPTEDGSVLREGLLLRGSEMNSHHTLTEKGRDALRALGVRSVLDLRGASEVRENVLGTAYLNVPASAYAEFLLHRDSLLRMIEFLADEKNYPVYFHCWGGADRTGTLAFLLGALLGLSYESLLDDYELTSLSVWGVRSRTSGNFQGLLDSFLSLSGETLKEKAEGYLLSAGVTAAQIERIRRILIKSTP